MSVSSLRLPLSPWITKASSSCFRFPDPVFVSRTPPLRPALLHFFSSSTASTDAFSTRCAPDQLRKWQAFRKKKVVLRIGYVGTDYRGPHFTLLSVSLDHPLVNPSPFLINSLVLTIQGYKCNATNCHIQVSFSLHYIRKIPIDGLTMASPEYSVAVL
uniref:Uncharacterized protein n=1 Tax=Cucumis sativus TaxID=3659 RepID=A0A0A0LVB6_CUCSA